MPFKLQKNNVASWQQAVAMMGLRALDWMIGREIYWFLKYEPEREQIDPSQKDGKLDVVGIKFRSTSRF